MMNSICICGVESGTGGDDCERCRLIAEIERLQAELKQSFGRVQVENTCLRSTIAQIVELLEDTWAGRLDHPFLTCIVLEQQLEEARAIAQELFRVVTIDDRVASGMLEDHPWLEGDDE